MNTMAPARLADLHACRVHLITGPVAAAGARGQVRAASCARDAAAGPDVAVLVTSDLVTRTIRHEAGQTVTLAIGCAPASCALVSATPRAPCRRRRAPQPARRPGGACRPPPSRLSGAATAPPRARPCTSRPRSRQTSPKAADAARGGCRSRYCPEPETPACRPAPSPYTCTHDSGHAGQASR